MRKSLFSPMSLILIVALMAFSAPRLPVSLAQDGGLMWPAWEEKDLSALGDDNSGSTWALSEDIQTPGGSVALQVAPSGTSEETKLAFPVSGADLQDWVTHREVALEVFLP